jgi:ABC-2 type transport system ATP-binding protein
MHTTPHRVRAIIAAGLALLATVGLGGVPAFATSVGPVAIRIPGGPSSVTVSKPVNLDAELYLPAKTPAPAVVLAHGFGGSKSSVSHQAQSLADAGFVVLAYSARGFGKSVGKISMNSPQFEVADAQAVIDYLAHRPEVLLDKPGDPRVGIAGSSYGGALALLAGGYDTRIDAIGADVTWNDLQSALFPQSVVGSATPGVFKQLWTSYFFSSGLLPTQGGTPTLCGRFSLAWCGLYLEAVESGTVTPAAAALMRASSPASVTARITAPTLLTTGLADSLFPLSQADATARQIKAAHPQTPVKVVWHSGGHDGGVSEQARLEDMLANWFRVYLNHQGHADTGFEVTFVKGSILTRRSNTGPDIQRAPAYPGLGGETQTAVSFTGSLQPVLAPAGGLPAAISVLPGVGGVGALAGSAMPGQSASFESAPLASSLSIVGSSRVSLRLASPATVDDVVLFASLRVVSPSGVETMPNGLVAPIRIAQLGPTPLTVTVNLPGIALQADPGDTLRLVIGTTDSGFRLPARPAMYVIGLSDHTVSLATVNLLPLHTPVAAYWWLIGAFGLVLLVGVVVFIGKPRRHAGDLRTELIDVPLAVEGLVKEFKGGVRAVDGLSFTIPAGEVIGLLGPNGAGKTTTMRMAMGLIRPTQGDVYVFGERIVPGSPVLARVGALVEGAGFLPHLSGRENLELYWRASGRTAEDPKFDQVFAIANLGTAVERKVRTYSQGMRQRLGIAQGMLGMPDVLMLDEPTNGLDPQQIRAMRDVMHDYASTGRTVIVSSHMLSEVEQTCSFVVVMHRGQLVTTGEVKDLLAGRSNMRLEDFFLEVVGDDLTVGKA